MSKLSSIVVFSLFSARVLRAACPGRRRESHSCDQSEVFTLAGADPAVKVKKVLDTKVSFLRTPLSWRMGAGSVRAKVSWLRNGCIRLVDHARQAFAWVFGAPKVSRLRTLISRFLMPFGQAVKVRFLRTTVSVTHCIFVIYNKVSLTY